MWTYLRAVFSVDLHVVVAEVAGPDPRPRPPAAEVDTDGVLGPRQHRRALLLAIVRVRFALVQHAHAIEAHADAARVESVHAGLADGHGEAAPVGVAGMQRGLDQRRMRDREGDLACLGRAARAADRDGDEA